MKIGFLINSLEGGGAERVVSVLANKMAEDGHQVYLFLINNTIEYTIHKDVKIYTLNSFKKNKILALIQVYMKFSKLYKEIEKKLKFDFFTSHLPFSNYLAILARVNNHYIVIHSTYSKLFKNKIRLYLNIKILNNKNIITVSNGMLQDLIVLGLNPKKSSVIYNPFDIHTIKKNALITNLNIPKENYIISVGRLSKEKRFDHLIQAYSKMNHTNLKLVILGKGEEETSLKELTIKLKINEDVIFAGWQSNPYNWIKNASLYVLTSEYEGLPTALIESLICGTAIVSVNCPSGPNEILINDLKEYLVPVDNLNLLVKAIENSLDKYPNIRPAHVERFTSSNVVDKYLKLGKQNETNI